MTELPNIDQHGMIPPYSDLAAKCHAYECTIAKLFRLGGHTVIGLSTLELTGRPVVTIGEHARGMTMVRCES